MQTTVIGGIVFDCFLCVRMGRNKLAIVHSTFPIFPIIREM